MYADASRETFRALDLKASLKGAPKEDRKSYVPSSAFVDAISSTWVGIKKLSGFAGNKFQV